MFSRPACAPLRAPALVLALAGAALVAPAHAASCALAWPAVAPPASVVVAVPLLNLRAAPRLSAPILRRLPRGTVLRLRFYHVSWAAVTAPDDTIGYVDRYAVRPLAPAPVPVVRARGAPARVPARLVSVTVAAPAVNLRATPDPAAPILALPRRTPLTVLSVDRTGTWARVATRGPGRLDRTLPDAVDLAGCGTRGEQGRPGRGRGGDRIRWAEPNGARGSHEQAMHEADAG